MTIESATYIDDLDATYPAFNDKKSEGDDHIRLIKSVLKTTFPAISGAVTPTHTELNYVDGVTSAIQTQINTINTQLASTLFPNVNATVNTSDEELNFVDGVTSAIQTQLDGRLKTTLSAATTVTGGAYTLTFAGNVDFGSATTNYSINLRDTVLVSRASGASAYPTIGSAALSTTKVFYFAINDVSTYATSQAIDLGEYPVFQGTLQGNTVFTVTVGNELGLASAISGGPTICKIMVKGHASSAYTTTFNGSGVTLIWEGGSAPGSLPAGDMRIVDVLIRETALYMSYKDYPA